MAPSSDAATNSVTLKPHKSGFPCFSDGDVVISLSAKKEHTLVLHRTVLEKHSEFFRSGFRDEWIHNKITHVEPEGKIFLRYELEGKIDYPSGELPLLLGKTKDTPKDQRKPSPKDLLNKVNLSDCFQDRTLVGHMVAFAMLYGEQFEVPGGLRPINALGAVETAEMYGFLTTISDSVVSRIVRDGWFNHRTFFAGHLIKGDPHVCLTIATKLECKQLYEEALCHSIGFLCPVNSSSDVRCSQALMNFVCDQKQRHRIYRARQSVYERVSDVTRMIFNINTIDDEDATSTSAFEAFAIWRQWLVDNYQSTWPPSMVRATPVGYDDEDGQWDPDFDLLDTLHGRKVSGQTVMNQVMAKRKPSNEVELTGLLQAILDQASLCPMPLFSDQYTAMDKPVELFSYVDFKKHPYPWEETKPAVSFSFYERLSNDRDGSEMDEDE